MDIAPLALVVLLGYGLLIAISLTTWTAVSYFRQEPESDEGEPIGRATSATREKSRTNRQLSNDDVRGARSRRVRAGADPFQGEEAIPTAAATGASAVRETQRVTWKPERTAPPTERPSSATPRKSEGSSDARMPETSPPSTEFGRPTVRERSATPAPIEKAERTPPARRTDPRDESDDEDAFERFLKSRSDDFDLR